MPSPIPDPTLALALQTLDQADRDRLRESVRTMVLQADPSHAPEAIDQALAVVWSGGQVPQVPMPGVAGWKPDFGWDRPSSEMNRQIQMKGGWLGAVNHAFDRWAGTSLTKNLGLAMVGLLLIPMGTLTGLGCLVGHLLGLGSPRWICLSALVSSGLSVVYWCKLGQQETRRRSLSWFKGNLQAAPKDYLAFASTRAYLRGVLASGLPDLMCEDADRLERLYQQEVVAKQDAELKEKQAVRQAQQTQEHQSRMRMFAEGLSTSPDE